MSTCNPVSSVKKTPLLCGNGINISCMQLTEGKPTFVPEKDQLPMALDTQARALWIYTCEGEWFNTATPMPPITSSTVAAAQAPTAVLTRINGAHLLGCVNPGVLTVSWELVNSLQEQIATGIVTIPETTGFVNLPMPDLTGLSSPFELITIASDNCGVSLPSSTFFTTA